LVWHGAVFSTWMTKTRRKFSYQLLLFIYGMATSISSLLAELLKDRDDVIAFLRSKFIAITLHTTTSFDDRNP
jgi:hypothetical protein